MAEVGSPGLLQESERGRPSSEIDAKAKAKAKAIGTVTPLNELNVCKYAYIHNNVITMVLSVCGCIMF